MDRLGIVVRWELGVFLVTLLAIVAFRLVTRRIEIRGLLATSVGQPMSVERIQLLTVTLGVAAYLLMSVSGEPPYAVRLPSEWAVYLLGGSEGLYLLTKYTKASAASLGQGQHGPGR